MVNAAGTAASLAILAGCTGEVNQEQEPWQATIPEIPSQSIAPTHIDLCEEPNIRLPKLQISDKISEDYDTILEGGLRDQFNPLTLSESLQLMEDLQDEYGLSISFPENPTSVTYHDFGTITDDPEAMEAAVTTNLISIVEAVRLFSPDILKAINLSEIAFVKDIVRKPTYEGEDISLDVIGGLYDQNNNRIYIDMTSFDDSNNYFVKTQHAVVHEILHAIDHQLLCSDQDFFVDEAFTKLNTQPYQEYNSEEMNVDIKYIRPSKHREFANDYGTSNVVEDRATILEWTLTKRGLIQPGDPDADSPLARKQEELVRRLEELNPGISNFLQLITNGFRDGTAHRYSYDNYTGQDNELDLYMTTEHFPEEYISAEETIRRGIEQGINFEVLTNGILEVQRPYSSQPIIVRNPIILRSPEGEVAGVAWSSGSRTGSSDSEILFNVEAHFFDRTRMNLRFEGDKPELLTSPVIPKIEGEASTGDMTFYTTTLEIAGLISEEVPIEQSSDQIESSYPNSL